MPGKGESASVSGHCSRPLLSLSRRRILGTVYSSTPTREELLKRAKYRFTSAHTANSWVAFFFSPRKRSFTNPNFSFITANTCSTFERTVDLLRFFARSTSSTPVKRHLVCKRWTIEKADENSNGIPWFVLHRPNSDKLRFHLPSLPWHWFDA